MNPANYKAIKQIYNGGNSEVYRAIDTRNDRLVMIKTLKQDCPLPQELARYKQEYELICQIKTNGVIKAYGLEEVDNKTVIILEDFGGESLKKLMENQRINLTQFLSIAIKIIDSLGQVHAANIIHKDINPSNIIYNPQTEQLKIIDFGISTRLSRENPTLKNPNILEGTLAYISPEQTGRMNRSLDYRTDFYSLGVTLYELLTKQLPFSPKDDLELVHCHIAKQPLTPFQIDPNIPIVISRIIMKLMEKNAEARYQSAWGLKADLEHCLKQLETGNLNEFELGTHDISEKFLIPQKLYGRETEIAQLLQAFEHVTQGNSQLLLVAGYSGIGKSALVQELYRPITAKRGYFISGKFDQFQRNIPYSAVIQAFRDLIRQLLTETQTQLEYWKTQLLHALGNNAQVVIDVISEVELIIGEQPAVSILAPTESQNRFNLVFQNFIKVFCQSEHPLVIFLDDLQWIDSASLKLMTLMMNDIPHLLLIGAYRDNEVNAVHPLIISLEEMQKQGILIETLTLVSLILSDLNQLVSDALHLPVEQTLPLAELVLEKTGGNPFFSGEFLKTLYVEKLLNFDILKHQWKWDLNQIRSRNITDNIVELMTNKIQRLSLDAQCLLKLAAAVGSHFDLETLSIMYETSVENIEKDLHETLQEGLIVPISEQYKFVHDRIQQAAYLLISEEEKSVLHWQIGQLLESYLGENLEEKLFEVVDHLNKGSSFVTTSEEKLHLIQLNLKAGQKAKQATAYRMAVDYLHCGEKWLNLEFWQSNFELMLAYQLEMIEIMYLNGDFEQMERIAELILQQENLSLIDRIKVYEIRVQAYTSQTKLFKAIQTAREGLILLGIILPEQSTPEIINQALGEIALKWQGSSINALLNLPRMSDSKQLITMRLISSIIPACYQGMPEMFPLLVSNMVNLSIQHGNTEQTPFAYACYGLFLSSAMVIEEGYQFGQLAVQMQENLNIKTQRSKALFVANTFINPWKEHLAFPAQRLKEVYQLAMDEGNWEYAGYASATHCEYSFLCGQPLIEIEPVIASFAQIIKQLKQDTSVKFVKTYWMSALALLTPDRLSSITELNNELKQLLSMIESSNDYYGLFHFYINRLYVCYLFNEPQKALENALLVKQYVAAASGNYAVGFFYFYDSLTQLSLYSESEEIKKENILKNVSENQEKIRQWADHAPLNFRHKYELVEAEKARVLGQFEVAVKNYEKAIAGSKENDYIQEEALAYELAAKFYLNHGMERLAQFYLQEAFRCYQSWGAIAKLQQLQMRYSQLFVTTFKPTITTTTHTTVYKPTGSITAHGLDVNSISKASQILSGEIVLSRLLEKMMEIVIENAGAEHGFLILPTQDQWFIEAEGKIGQTDVVVLQSIPINDNRLVSSAMIHYVVRVQQPLVLDNAMRNSRFTNDSHIVQSQVKSVLVIPLKHQGKLTGILYLENNLTTGVFTPDRIEVLNLLSSQLAISIENALLYSNLEQKVTERTHELAEKNEQLIQLDQDKNEFLGIAAHDLKNPLSGILGLAEIISASEGQLSPEEILEYALMIEDSSRRMFTLITNLLDVNAIESGKINTNLEQVDVLPIVRNLVQTYSERAKAKNIFIDFQTTEDQHLAFIDRDIAQQVLDNLISNAIKYSPHHKKVTVKVFILNNEIRCEIKDEGVGLSKTDQQKLFGKFTRLSTKPTGGEHSTGLGLFIVKKLVSTMNGKVWCESELGKGANFIVTFPSTRETSPNEVDLGSME